MHRCIAIDNEPVGSMTVPASEPRTSPPRDNEEGANANSPVATTSPNSLAPPRENSAFDFAQEVGRTALAQLLLCRQLVQKRQFARAMRELDAMLNDNPSLGVVHYLRSLVYCVTGDLAAAKTSLESAIAGGYVRSIVSLLLAHLQTELGDTAEALRSAEHAKELDPQNAHAHQLCGSLLEQLGRDAEAASAYEMAVRLDPQSRQWRLRWANVLLRLGQQSLAEQAVLGALRLNPFDLHSRMNLGQLHWALGQLDAALAEFRAAQAMKLDGNSRAHFSVGKLHLEAGRREEAEQAFSEAVRVNPKDFDSFVALGELYSAQNKHAAARDAFASAVRIDRSVAGVRVLLAAAEAIAGPATAESSPR
jgi:tetratricopeptide (TPR) repeat protein